MEKKTNVKKALVITGGFCDTEGLGWLKESEYDWVIAADSGLRTAKKLGIVPDVIVGDFDSLGRVPGKGRGEGDAEIIRLPREKDVTDTMFACSCAEDRGCRDITVIGGTGGRADHTLSNIFLLEGLSRRSVKARICDGNNTIRYAENEKVEILNEGGYFSVLALDEECRVTETGCRYPLRDHALLRSDPFAVSNEVRGEKATVTVEGKAVIISSKK